MPSPLEKARQAPDSMKGRILSAARKLYGEYGFHGVTARMIAKEVGIDVSTLYYHWGDKQDLYEAVLTDLNEEIRQKLAEIEKIVRGKPIAIRLEVAIDVMCEHLFQNPETSNLMLFSFFSKTRTQTDLDNRMTEHLANIAVAMGLALDKSHVPPQANARVLAVWNSIINFASGENYFRPMLDLDRAAYLAVVKETLKFILIPAFTQAGPDAQGKERPGQDPAA
jgi:TetR/AcrR family transcriptional regulator, regulator of cefoperazone and chloramphenicol sensitivity